MAEYIDKELVIDTIDELKSKALPKALLFDHLKKVIEVFPTRDVAPVRHGRWYNRGGRFRCSVCDNKTLLKDIGGTGGWSHEYEQQKSPYCPNCGAAILKDGET